MAGTGLLDSLELQEITPDQSPIRVRTSKEESQPVKLKDIMSTEVETVRPDASIQEAAEKMRSLDVGALPVSDGRRLIGMITDRDITIRATAAGRDPKTTLVKDCLSSELVYGFEDQDVEEAQALMQQKQIRRLPVLSRDKQLVGIVALADLATKVSAAKAGKATQAISSSG
jgi:CBS domain-containing protein